MMIYKIKNKISFYIAGLLWLLSSCAENNGIMLSDDTGAVDVPIAVQMGLVNGSDENGTPEENAVRNLRVFIFNAVTGVCEKIHEYDFRTPSNNTFIIKAGKKHILSVANYDSSLAFVTDAIDYVTLLNKEYEYLNGDVMTDIQENVEISPDKPSTSPHSITVALKRLAVKVSLTVEVAEELKSMVSMSSIRAILANANRTTGYFLPSASHLVSMQVYQLSNTDATAVYEDTYILENESGSNRSTASYISLHSNVLGSDRSTVIYIGDTKVDGDAKRYNLYRNYWYKVHVKIVSIMAGELKVETSVLKWNLADKVTVADGFGFKTSTVPEFSTSQDKLKFSIDYVGGTPPFKVTWFVNRVKYATYNQSTYTGVLEYPKPSGKTSLSFYCKIEDADGYRLVSGSYGYTIK